LKTEQFPYSSCALWKGEEKIDPPGQTKTYRIVCNNKSEIALVITCNMEEGNEYYKILCRYVIRVDINELMRGRRRKWI